MTSLHLHVRHPRRAAGAALALLVLAGTLGAQGSPAPASGDTVVTLTLGDAARLAAQRGLGPQAARLRAEQAAARVRQRRAALLPSITGGASTGARTFNTATLGLDVPTGVNPVTGQPNPPLFDPDGQVEGPVRVTDVRGRVDQPLLDLGALGRVRAARAEGRAAEAEATSQAELAAGVAAVAYVRALRAESNLAARAADSALAAELLGIAREQLRAGVGVALDVTRAAAQAAATRAQLIAARNERDRSRIELLRDLDLPLDADLRLVDSLAAPAAAETIPDEAAATRQALGQRADLRAAAERLHAAEEQVRAMRAERLPTLGVFADDGMIGSDVSHLLNTYTWGVQLSMPLFDGARRASRVAEQRAVVREIDLRRRDLEQQAGAEVRIALLDVRSARENVEAARERLALSEQEVAQARDRFRAGVSGSADVVTASLSLTTARTALVDALSAYQGARIALARAEGSVTTLQ